MLATGWSVLMAVLATFGLQGEAPQAKPALPKVSKADATKLREQLAAALAGDGKALKQLETTAKALGSKHEFDSLLAALREGPALPSGAPKPRGKGKEAEKFEQFDNVLSGLSFQFGKDTFHYCVDVPKDYDPTRPAPVILDPGHGVGAKDDKRGKAGFTAFFRGRADLAGLENALVVRTELIEQIGADGVAGERPEDEIAAAFDACFRDLASRLAVDLDRVWVTGLSQTGFWSWHLGLTRPDRFAGLAPMGAVTWNTTRYLENLSNLAIYVLHGDGDTVCPVAQPRQTTKALTELGARVEYKEIAGGKHDASTWVHLDEALRWLAERPRDPYPKKLTRKLQTLQQPWCNWIRVDELKRLGPGKAGEAPTATLAARIEGQVVHIDSEGVERITLGLSRELLDLSLPVKVIWNGKQELERKLERDFQRTVALAVEKCDWRGTFEVAVELKR